MVVQRRDDPRQLRDHDDDDVSSFWFAAWLAEWLAAFVAERS